MWSSFVIRGNRHNIFFGADSGMFSGFRSIGGAYGPFDLTMLEIGAYDADWPDIHMGPIHAAEAHVDLKGKRLLPIHWGLFNLAFHPWREPIERLITAAARQNLQLFLPSPGHPTEVTGQTCTHIGGNDKLADRFAHLRVLCLPPATIAVFLPSYSIVGKPMENLSGNIAILSADRARTSGITEPS